MIIRFNSEGTQCVLDPIKFGVEQARGDNSIDFECVCGFKTKGANTLIINSQGKRIIQNNFSIE